ncbi:MAG: hypothetical protein KAV82_01005, partial [Phycisphaerae bacterium]|nr:hypothetical protein [Phycisphaerae bacterium]
GWQLESRLGRETAANGRTLLGQYFASAELADALADDWWDLETFEPIVPGEVTQPIALVESVKLCFNPAGRPNRLRRPIRLTYPGKCGEDDCTVDIYVFTDPDSPHAEPWTYHQALQYLWFVAMCDSVVRAGNLFDPEAAINLGPGGVPTHRMVPADVGTLEPGWLKAMVRHCETFAPEGRTIVEALVLLNQLCGLRFCEGIDNLAGEPVSRMQFWAPGDNQQVEMLEAELDGSPFNLGGTPRDPETDLLLRNNVTNARVLRDWTNVINHVRVVGDRRYFVLRVGLLPLWQPHTGWDGITQDPGELVDAATGGADFELQKDSLWYQRHFPGGSLWATGENSIAGRLYGADFGAELDPAVYDRPDPPYDNYGAIDWAAMGTWGPDGAPAGLVRRRRRIMPLTAVDGAG